MDAYTTTTTSAQLDEPLTIEKVKEAVAKLKALGPEPIGEYMRKQGFPPEKGGLMILPEQMRDQVGMFPPSYVAFVPWTKDAILCWSLAVVFGTNKVEER